MAVIGSKHFPPPTLFARGVANIATNTRGAEVAGFLGHTCCCRWGWGFREVWGREVLGPLCYYPSWKWRAWATTTDSPTLPFPQGPINSPSDVQMCRYPASWGAVQRKLLVYWCPIGCKLKGRDEGNDSHCQMLAPLYSDFLLDNNLDNFPFTPSVICLFWPNFLSYCLNNSNWIFTAILDISPSTQYPIPPNHLTLS